MARLPAPALATALLLAVPLVGCGRFGTPPLEIRMLVGSALRILL
jgi:hypothetical protein